MDWRQHAQCRIEGTDPELFFPITEFGPGAVQVQRAKAVCGRCAVTSQCLSDALAAGLDHGVFGGMSESERRNTVTSDWALAA